MGTYTNGLLLLLSLDRPFVGRWVPDLKSKVLFVEKHAELSSS